MSTWDSRLIQCLDIYKQHRCSACTQSFLESQDIRTDYELLDMVMKEAARQVAGSCAERGRLMLKVCGRLK
jgi:hypothetical protein